MPHGKIKELICKKMLWVWFKKKRKHQEKKQVLISYFFFLNKFPPLNHYVEQPFSFQLNDCHSSCVTTNILWLPVDHFWCSRELRGESLKNWRVSRKIGIRKKRKKELERVIGIDIKNNGERDRQIIGLKERDKDKKIDR